jgi:myosin heavy subunit
LLFADRATKIKNQAKRNEILDDKALCIKLQEELKRANEEIIRLQKENDKYKKENTKLKHTLSSLEQQTQVNQIPILTDDNNSDMDDSNIKQIKKNQQNDKKLIINQFSEEEIFDKKSKKTKGKQNEAFNIESYIKSIEDSYEEKLKKIEKERDEIANNFTNLLADNKTIIEKQSQQINQLHLTNDTLQEEINSLKKEKETIKQMIMEATSSLGELNFLDSIKNIKIQMEDLRRQNSILKQNNSLDIDIQTKYIKDIENNITKQESDKNEINIQLNEISSKLNLNDSASSFQTKEDSSQIENQTSKKSLNSKVKKERKNLERKYSELLTILKQIDSDIKMNITIFTIAEIWLLPTVQVL